MTKIFIAEPLYADYAAEAAIAAPNTEIVSFDGNQDIIPGIEEADAVAWFWYPRHRLETLARTATKLKWLNVGSAGVDWILDSEIKSKKDLILTDSGPAYDIAIPEYVLAWMLTIAKRVPQFLDHQRKHEWIDEIQGDLYGSTLGVIGLGPIGRGVATRCKAFGMRTMGFRRQQKPVDSVDEVLTGPEGLSRLVEESDYIVLAAALTEGTRQVLGKEQIAQLKNTAWVINIARGALIDQEALTIALQERRIGGACLDVFTQEPLPTDSPLWDLPNVLITPHDSHGGGQALAKRRKEVFIDNLRRFAAGEPLENVVSFENGY